MICTALARASLGISIKFPASSPLGAGTKTSVYNTTSYEQTLHLWKYVVQSRRHVPEIRKDYTTLRQSCHKGQYACLHVLPPTLKCGSTLCNACGLFILLQVLALAGQMVWADLDMTCVDMSYLAINVLPDTYEVGLIQCSVLQYGKFVTPIVLTR